MSAANVVSLAVALLIGLVVAWFLFRAPKPRRNLEADR